MKPIIWVVTTSGEDSLEAYLESIAAHGGEPRVVGPVSGMPELDGGGVLLTGGGDLQEKYYDHAISEEERRTLGKIEPERDAFEWGLMDRAAVAGIPVLGICRGIQIMNAYAGGTLIPDLPSWQAQRRMAPLLAHRQQGDKGLPAHAVEVMRGSGLATVLGGDGRIEVNSSHHQALSRCGATLRVSAVAPDGVIEAVEDPRHVFWLGVQFHPERMWKKFPIFARLFEGFVHAAA